MNIDAVVKTTRQSKASIETALHALMAAVGGSMSMGGGPVKLVGFGSFAVEQTAAGSGRNPATGKELKIPARKIVKFKAGSKLKEAVDAGEAVQ